MTEVSKARPPRRHRSAELKLPKCLMLVFIPPNPGLLLNLPVPVGKTSAFDSLGDWTWTGWLTTETASLLCQVHLYLVLLPFTGTLWTRWTCSYTFLILQRHEASVQDVTMKIEVESQPNIFSKLFFRRDIIEHACFVFPSCVSTSNNVEPGICPAIPLQPWWG